MSVESIARALVIQDLTAATKLVLIGIANHDGDGGAWPSIATLAKYGCMSERQVQRHVAELQRLGLLTVHQNAGGTRTMRTDRRPNLYELHIRGVTSASPREGSDGVTSTAPRGDIAMSPEPSRNRPTTPLPPSRGSGGRRSAPAARLAPLGPHERPDDFAAWYAQYPRKTKKVDAVTAWRQMLPTLPPLANLIAATRLVIETARMLHPATGEWERYVPYPASFLRGGRWVDLEDVGAARQVPNRCAPCGAEDPVNNPQCSRIGWSRDDECPWRATT